MINKAEIIWGLDTLNKINEAIEFDHISSYDYVFTELLMVYNCIENGGILVYEESKIVSIEMFFDFIDKNLVNSDYIKKSLLKELK